ncbi:MAG: sodium:solute symporter family protein, partial [Candidatus Kapaibacterium sp.]
MNATLIAIAAYVLAQLGIGWYVSRRITTEDDYLVAGRSLGYVVATFTIFATWFGAETCIGAAGAIYTNGLSGGSADPFGYAICLFAMGLFLAVPLWRLRLTTMGDLFRHRYGTTVERIAVLLMAPTSLLWAAAQIRAFGQVISASSGLAVDLTISLAALIVILYTMFGGLLADAWTDTIQGVALMVGLAVLFILFIGDVGFDGFAAVEPSRFNLFPFEKEGILSLVEKWAIPVCGSLMAAELVSRIIATRSPQVARRSSLMAGGVYLLFGMIPVAIGLVGATIMPGLSEPEHLLPMIAQRYLPGVLYALFAGALVSAILSTVDSALLVASSLISHNLIVPLRPGMSEK